MVVANVRVGVDFKMNSVTIHSTKELEFAIFCVDFVARKLGLPPDIVYKRLKESGLLQNYIIDNYEVLHTLGKDYLVDDIVGLMAEKGLL